MKKIFYFLFCIFLFVGCDHIVLRKDKSERVTFDKNISQGTYTLYMYEINYPKTQKDKIVFMSRFENFLKNRDEKGEQNINFILPKELYEDVESIINEDGIGIEKNFFKSASFIDENDKKIIDKETRNIKYPLNGGEIQKYLNKQYYYILSLVGREKEYKKDFFYTEFDKRIIINEYVKERENLKNILIEKKKDFLMLVENINDLENNEEDMVYLKEDNKNFEKNIINHKVETKQPILVLKSDDYKGYTVNGKSIIFFVGNGEEINYFRGYNFNVKIKEIDDFNYSNFVKDKKQIEVSTLLDRKKYVPRRPLEK